MEKETIKAVYLGANSELEKHILRACGNRVTLQAFPTAEDLLKALEMRCIDIVCLDHSHAETLRLLRQFPLPRLAKLYLVIVIATSDNSCRRLSHRGAQYVASYQAAAAEIPQMVNTCVSLVRLEQRQRPGSAMQVPAMIREASDGKWAPSVITEVSQFGCRIISEHALTLESDVSLRFRIGEMDAVMDASAKVVWTDSVGQHGLIFTYIYPAQLLRLRAWLCRRNGRILMSRTDSTQTVAAAAH